MGLPTHQGLQTGNESLHCLATPKLRREPNRLLTAPERPSCPLEKQEAVLGSSAFLCSESEQRAQVLCHFTGRIPVWFLSWITQRLLYGELARCFRMSSFNSAIKIHAFHRSPPVAVCTSDTFAAPFNEQKDPLERRQQDSGTSQKMLQRLLSISAWF